MQPAPRFMQPETVDSLLAQLKRICGRYPIAGTQSTLGRRYVRPCKRLIGAGAYSSNRLVDRQSPPCKGGRTELGAHGTELPDKRCR